MIWERHFTIYVAMKTGPSSSKGEKSPCLVIPQGGLCRGRWTDSSAKEHRHRFKSCLYLSLAVRAGASYLTSLSFSCHSCKMVLISDSLGC